MTQLPAIDPRVLAFLAKQQNYQQQVGQQANNQYLDLLRQILTGGQTAFQNAFSANTGRYNDILEMFGINRERALGGLENFGQSQLADANAQWNKRTKDLDRMMADSGMPGSTRHAALGGEVEGQRLRAIGQLQSDINDRKMATDERFVDKATGVMEQRTDQYPPSGAMAGIGGALGQLANAGGGAPGGNRIGGILGNGQIAARPVTPPGSSQPPPGRESNGLVTMPTLSGIGGQVGGALAGREPNGAIQLPSPPVTPAQQQPAQQIRRSPGAAIAQPNFGNPAAMARIDHQQAVQQNRIADVLNNRMNGVDMGARNAQLAVAQADQGQMGHARDNAGINQANLTAVANGHANYTPGQPAPTIPGAPPSLMNGNFGGSLQDALGFLAPYINQAMGQGGGAAQYSQPPQPSTPTYNREGQPQGDRWDRVRQMREAGRMATARQNARRNYKPGSNRLTDQDFAYMLGSPDQNLLTGPSNIPVSALISMLGL